MDKQHLQHFKKDNPNVLLGYGKPEIWDDGYEYTDEEREKIIEIFGEVWFKQSPNGRYLSWRAYCEFGKDYCNL